MLQDVIGEKIAIAIIEIKSNQIKSWMNSRKKLIGTCILFF